MKLLNIVEILLSFIVLVAETLPMEENTLFYKVTWVHKLILLATTEAQLTAWPCIDSNPTAFAPLCAIVPRALMTTKIFQKYTILGFVFVWFCIYEEIYEGFYEWKVARTHKNLRFNAKM